MHATVRRYRRIRPEPQGRADQQGQREPPAPPQQDAGLNGYHLHRHRQGRHGDSISFFDTSARADESTRFVATWLREEKLENVLPNSPRITVGEVIAPR